MLLSKLTNPVTSLSSFGLCTGKKQGIALGAARRYAPADGSSIQNSRRIYVRSRTGPQSTHLWWPAVAKLQAASVPIAYRQLRHGTDRRTDRQTDGRIALFQNACLWGEGIIAERINSFHLPTKFSQPPNLHINITSSQFSFLTALALHLLDRPSTSSSLRITDRSFQYASPRLWNQLPASLRQPRTNLSISHSPIVL